MNKNMNEEYKVSDYEYKTETDGTVGIGVGIQGFYKVQVINSTTKEIVADYGWHKNLILNAGMDAVGTAGLGYLNRYGIAGTGSRPNSVSSSTSTITQSGTSLYLYERTGLPNFTSSYSTYTASVNVGDVFVYGNNSQSTVVSITDGFNLQVDTSYNIDAANSQSFIIWKTSQTGLEKEIKRSGTYLPGAGNCGTTTSHSVKTFRRTYDFTAEASQKDYSEVGVSWTSTPNAGVFSRIVLPQTVSVAATYQLRLVHDLRLEFQPNSPRYITASIAGWDTAIMATESLQVFSLADVSTAGAWSIGYGDAGFYEPTQQSGYYYNYCMSFFSDVRTAPAVFGSYVNRTLNGSLLNAHGQGGTVAAYTNGSYVRYKTGTFALTDAVGTGICCLGMGIGYFGGATAFKYPNGDGQGIVLVFDTSSYNKFNTQIASVTYKWSWSRILENGIEL